MGLRTGPLENRKAATKLDTKSHPQPRPLAPVNTDQHCCTLSGHRGLVGWCVWPEGGLDTGVPGGFGQTVRVLLVGEGSRDGLGRRPPRCVTVPCPGCSSTWPLPRRVRAPRELLGRRTRWPICCVPPRGARRSSGAGPRSGPGGSLQAVRSNVLLVIRAEGGWRDEQGRRRFPLPSPPHSRSRS